MNEKEFKETAIKLTIMHIRDTSNTFEEFKEGFEEFEKQLGIKIFTMHTEKILRMLWNEKRQLAG